MYCAHFNELSRKKLSHISSGYPCIRRYSLCFLKHESSGPVVGLPPLGVKGGLAKLGIDAAPELTGVIPPVGAAPPPLPPLGAGAPPPPLPPVLGGAVATGFGVVATAALRLLHHGHPPVRLRAHPAPLQGAAPAVLRLLHHGHPPVRLRAQLAPVQVLRLLHQEHPLLLRAGAGVVTVAGVVAVSSSSGG